MKVAAIILAAGEGRRFGQPKALVQTGGQTLLEHNLELFRGIEEVNEIIVVAPKEQLAAVRKIVDAKTTVVAGGASRADSLAKGLQKSNGELILVHNVANPFATPTEVKKTIAAAARVGAAGVGRPVASTIKRVCSTTIRETLPRHKLYEMETPQVVLKELLLAGLAIAKKEKIDVTDDLQLAELAGVQPRILRASEQNIKITFPHDLPTEYRSGLGQDSHRFAEARKPLILGGVQISQMGGLAGNSDADVIIHALCNALSSAIGGGSLSTWSDEMCKKKGIKDSKRYLAAILKKVHEQGWQVVNCSVTIEAGKPKLEKHLPKINRSLAKLLSAPTNCVGCTVTSGEGLTAFGRGEGMQVFVLVLLKR